MMYLGWRFVTVTVGVAREEQSSAFGLASQNGPRQLLSGFVSKHFRSFCASSRRKSHYGPRFCSAADAECTFPSDTSKTEAQFSVATPCSISQS